MFRISGRMTGPIMVLALGLGACSPHLAKGVDEAALDAALTRGIGDPNTCVLVGKASTGQVLHRYGAYTVCARPWPVCSGPELKTALDRLRGAGETHASCASTADGARQVAWSMGPVEGQPGLAYVAVMEGPNTPPGIVITERIKSAFRRAGRSPVPAP